MRRKTIKQLQIEVEFLELKERLAKGRDDTVVATMVHETLAHTRTELATALKKKERKSLK